MMQDIEIGTVFSWGDRPVLKVKNTHNMIFHDGYIVIGTRPNKWWHLRAWYKVMKQLWKMPYDRH